MMSDRAQNGQSQERSAIPAIVATSPIWLVLRCRSSDTLALARKLEEYGAWVPVWKRQRRLPRSNVRRLVKEPCIPSFVFIPEGRLDQIPKALALSYSVMRIDGTIVRVPDRAMEPLRNRSEEPVIKARDLPKPGTRFRFTEGPFQGLDAKVISCRSNAAKVAVDGFPFPIEVPPSLAIKK